MGHRESTQHEQEVIENHRGIVQRVRIILENIEQRVIFFVFLCYTYLYVVTVF